MSQPDREVARAHEAFREAAEVSAEAGARLLAETAHAADAAAWLQDLDDEQSWRVFALLDRDHRADLLDYAEEGLRDALVERMTAGDLREVVEELPADQAVDVLAKAEEHVVEAVLEAMPTDVARDLRELRSYPPDTAGGVMTTEFITVPLGARIGDAVKAVKQEGEDAEENLGVFVIDQSGAPIGYLVDRDLLTHSIHTTVDDVMVPPFTVDADEDQEEAANLILKYALSALGVVGPDGVLVGVISAEDAAEVLERETSEDIGLMVGTVAADQQTRLPIATRVRQRMPLMALTVGGGLTSAEILRLFLGDAASDPSGTGSILRYLPLIIGLAGNVGIQSSTILVRGFATGEIEPERELAVLRSEVTVGSIVGLVCGALTVVFASLMEGGDWNFGLAVGTAVTAAVAWAAVLGCVVPIGCRRLGVDPAVVAGPFLICLSDVSGSAIYLLVALQLVGLD